MKIFHLLSFATLSVLLLGCDLREVKTFPVPKGAHGVTADMQYVTLRSGTGLAAMDGGIWGVETLLLSHRERDCHYPCEHYALYRRFDWHLDPWNPLVKTMREGETRRVWLKVPNRSEPLVYDVTLASVVKTDSAGEPVYPHVQVKPPPRRR
jgi:hypothetical protein